MSDCDTIRRFILPELPPFYFDGDQGSDSPVRIHGPWRAGRREYFEPPGVHTWVGYVTYSAGEVSEARLRQELHGLAFVGYSLGPSQDLVLSQHVDHGYFEELWSGELELAVLAFRTSDERFYVTVQQQLPGDDEAPPQYWGLYMSSTPFHPQGVGLSDDSGVPPDDSILIHYRDLPRDCRRAVVEAATGGVFVHGREVSIQVVGGSLAWLPSPTPAPWEKVEALLHRDSGCGWLSEGLHHG